MSYLNNKTVVVDATLTNIGRQRFAEGKFEITKFALADDEIDYGLYNFSHPNGTAYYDEAILATPILEPVVDERSLMKNKLFTPDSSQTFIGNIPTVYIDDKVAYHGYPAYYILPTAIVGKYQAYLNSSTNPDSISDLLNATWKYRGVDKTVSAFLIKFKFVNGPRNATYAMDFDARSQQEVAHSVYFGLGGNLYTPHIPGTTGNFTLINEGASGTTSDEDWVYIAIDMSKFTQQVGSSTRFDVYWREETTGMAGHVPVILAGLQQYN